jgi:hypothetical protein
VVPNDWSRSSAEIVGPLLESPLLEKGSFLNVESGCWYRARSSGSSAKSLKLSSVTFQVECGENR